MIWGEMNSKLEHLYEAVLKQLKRKKFISKSSINLGEGEPNHIYGL